MLPLRDNIPSRSVPFVNYALIGACTLVFLVQQMEEPGKQTIVERFGMIPLRIVKPDEPVMIPEPKVVRVRDQFGREFQKVELVPRPAAPPVIAPWLTLFTCMFLHGSWMHIIGNMWFLYIFGDNVEDRFGHLGYLLFYLGCGLAAGLAHLLTNALSPIPTVGASGAIAGVMGGYLLSYPRAKVLTLIPFIYLQIVVLPAPIFLGIWFLMQLMQGTFSIGATQAAGVAWWAHIGGFAAGAAVVWLLGFAHLLRPRVEATLPNTDRVTQYRYRSPRQPWE